MYLILGNSAAGIACIEAIRLHDKTSEIALVSEEEFRIYSRCLLPYFLAGDIRDQRLLYRTDSFYRANRVTPYLGTRCEKVVPEERIALLAGGQSIRFDRALIATGARPVIPTIKGIEKDGVFALRTIEDVRGILKFVKRAKHVAVLGGGLVGMKAAYGLSKHVRDVSVIVKSDQILSRILDPKAALIVQHWVEKRARILTNLEAVEVLGRGKVEAIRLNNGRAFECDIVVIAKGAVPNSEIIAGSAGTTDHCISVDEFQKTSLEDVYAAGDVARTKERRPDELKINALWPNAVEQGRVAGVNMAGGAERYDGSSAMNSVEFFGLPVISAGATAPKEGFTELIYEDKNRNVYKKVFLSGHAVVGMLFVNDIKSASVIRNLIRTKTEISGIRDIILDENFDLSRVDDLLKKHRGRCVAGGSDDITISY